MAVSGAVDTRNGFTFIRILAALAVICSHGYDAAGIHGDFLTPLGIYPISKFGVDTFFAISGYLVTQSLLRNPSIPNYFASRCLRIFPGLIVALLSTIVAASFFYEGTNYFTSAGTWDYLGNINLFSLVQMIPGTFGGNHTQVINGSLWTLPLELSCYIALACIVWSGALNIRLLTISIITLILLHFWGGIPRELFIFNMSALFLNNLSILFFMGSLIALIGKKLPVSPWLTLAAFLIIVWAYYVSGTVWKFNAAFHLTLLPYVVITFAMQTKRLHFLNKYDISYGLYIYGFVVQQCFESYFRQHGIQATPWTFFVAVSTTTAIIAFLSWRLIEKPALKLKGIFFKRPKVAIEPASANL